VRREAEKRKSEAEKRKTGAKKGGQEEEVVR